MNTADMIANADRSTALWWHLAYNHYPAVPASMIPACEAAIDLALADEWDALVTLPEGVSYRGATAAPAWAVVEQHHLAPFVEVVEWVVVNEDDAYLYWSNEDGWGDRASATVFADGERPSLSLPQGGAWERY